MPLSAVINDGYNRQIILLRQIVTMNINNTSKIISMSHTKLELNVSYSLTGFSFQLKF